MTRFLRRSEAANGTKTAVPTGSHSGTTNVWEKKETFSEWQEK
jgi:hypothetical protein